MRSIVRRLFRQLRKKLAAVVIVGYEVIPIGILRPLPFIREWRGGFAIVFSGAILLISKQQCRLVQFRKIACDLVPWLTDHGWRLSPVFIEQLANLESERTRLSIAKSRSGDSSTYVTSQHLFDRRNFRIRREGSGPPGVDISLSGFGGFGHFIAEILPLYLWFLSSGWKINDVVGDSHFVDALRRLRSTVVTFETDAGDGNHGQDSQLQLVDGHHYPSAQSIAILRSIVPNGSAGAARRRIFVSRSPGIARSRFLENEPEALSVLAPFGFKVLNPEEHSFETQVSMFSEAEIVVGVHGSGMFNTCFMPRGGTVIEIAPLSDYRWGVVAICKAAGLNHRVAWGSENDVNGRFRVNCQEILDQLEIR